MSQNEPLFGHQKCNIALKEAKVGPERVQKRCVTDEERTNEQTDAHQNFEPLYTKAPKGAIILMSAVTTRHGKRYDNRLGENKCMIQIEPLFKKTNSGPYVVNDFMNK